MVQYYSNDSTSALMRSSALLTRLRAIYRVFTLDEAVESRSVQDGIFLNRKLCYSNFVALKIFEHL